MELSGNWNTKIEEIEPGIYIISLYLNGELMAVYRNTPDVSLETLKSLARDYQTRYEAGKRNNT